jgi:hypothetical protein
VIGRFLTHFGPRVSKPFLKPGIRLTEDLRSFRASHCPLIFRHITATFSFCTLLANLGTLSIVSQFLQFNFIFIQCLSAQLNRRLVTTIPFAAVRRTFILLIELEANLVIARGHDKLQGGRVSFDAAFPHSIWAWATINSSAYCKLCCDTSNACSVVWPVFRRSGSQ